jgi:predicted NodU family carbamoyl transferase
VGEVVALPDALRATARFGGAAVPLQASARTRWPSLAHVDGTCLPVVVHPGDVLDGVLAAWEQASGEPLAGLGSYHLPGQPIVHSPNDAARAWRDGRADAMLLGRYLLLPSFLSMY